MNPRPLPADTPAYKFFAYRPRAGHRWESHSQPVHKREHRPLFFSTGVPHCLPVYSGARRTSMARHSRWLLDFVSNPPFPYWSAFRSPILEIALLYLWIESCILPSRQSSPEPSHENCSVRALCLAPVFLSSVQRGVYATHELREHTRRGGPAEIDFRRGGII